MKYKIILVVILLLLNEVKINLVLGEKIKKFNLPPNNIIISSERHENEPSIILESKELYESYLKQTELSIDEKCIKKQGFLIEITEFPKSKFH